MTFNVWTFLFEILNFMVLAFFLHRLLYRPLRKAIDERKAENDRARIAADTARKEANAAKEQMIAKLAAIDQERQDLLSQAAAQVEIEKTKRLAEADTSAKTIREQARRDAEQLHRDTIAELQEEIGKLAVGLAERLLKQACDTSLNTQLVQHLMETIRANEREQIRQDAGTKEAVIESAMALDESTANNLFSAVRDLLGHECQLQIKVNPTLIGGALLRVGGHVWDATVAAQLEAARNATSGGK